MVPNLQISSTPARLQVRRASVHIDINRKEPFQSSRLQITPHSFRVQTGKSDLSISFQAVHEDLGFRSPISLRKHMEAKSRQKASSAISTAVSEGEAYLNNPSPDIGIQLSRDKGNYNAETDIVAKPSVGPQIQYSQSPPVKVEFQKGKSEMNYNHQMKVDARYQKPAIRLAQPGRVDIRA